MSAADEAEAARREAAHAAAGLRFYKLCGSGNDFVFFDAREPVPAAMRTPAAIAAVCNRRTGVGADGVVYLNAAAGEELAFGIRYHNSDGSLASFCGNAALCAARLAVELGIAAPTGFRFASDAGVITARLRDGVPEIDLAPVRELTAEVPGLDARPHEERLGFAVAGVPHLVVRVPDVEQVDVDRRGRELRFAAAVGAAGANVNFVSPAPSGDAWLMRTYERGVEGETLACGSGAVACATVLRAWGFVGREAVIVTRSGRPLHVRQPAADGSGPSLRGEGRIVFTGTIGELSG
jgi:diaminopimelate epimerase